MACVRSKAYACGAAGMRRASGRSVVANLMECGAALGPESFDQRFHAGEAGELLRKQLPLTIVVPLGRAREEMAKPLRKRGREMRMMGLGLRGKTTGRHLNNIRWAGALPFLLSARMPPPNQAMGAGNTCNKGRAQRSVDVRQPNRRRRLRSRRTLRR